MIPNFIPPGFQQEHRLELKPHDQDFIFIYSDNHIILLNNKSLPLWRDLKAQLSTQDLAYYCFGRFNNQACLLVDASPLPLTDAFTAPSLRACREILSQDHLRLAGLGNQLHYWRNRHRFCGRDGSKTQDKTDERAIICPQCQETYYPQLSPCIIVLVTRGREMLLAHSLHFPTKFYSTLAGFIEPGESAEDAVHREVKEEVNLNIKNVRYITSQPWPFPNSLMLGYLAEYESGEILAAPNEIADAQWFDPQQLPTLSPALSISRFLIDTHLQNI